MHKCLFLIGQSKHWYLTDSGPPWQCDVTWFVVVVAIGLFVCLLSACYKLESFEKRDFQLSNMSKSSSIFLMIDVGRLTPVVVNPSEKVY